MSEQKTDEVIVSKWQVGERSINEIIKDLSKPLPQRFIKTKPRKNVQLAFIEWHTAVQFLDYYAPGWSYEIKDIKLVGTNVAVIAKIIIPCAEGFVHREATGIEEEDLEGYGDPASNASAMALKRAAAMFGLGLWLYKK